MLDRRIISCLPTAERDPHCDKTYDCTINDRFFHYKNSLLTLCLDRALKRIRHTLHHHSCHFSLGRG